MMKPKVQWKRGSDYNVDPVLAYTIVEQLRKENNGNVTAEALVQVASAKRNPLHAEFTWDDTEAAREYRLVQARSMLRSFHVVRDELKTDRPQRVYQVVRERVTDKAGTSRARHVYKTIDDIMRDPDLRAEVLQRALRELISFRQRYRDLNELAVILRSIDDTLEKIKLA
jgi:hypothetical protein